jgi:hypothetical protein
MARAQIAERVNRNISNVSWERFPQAQINESIQKAYNWATVLTGAIQKSTVFPFATDTPYINFRQQIPDYFATIGIYNQITHRWLTPTSTKELDLWRWDWERWIGEPEYFFILDFNRVGMIPYQTAPVGTFILWYLAATPTLVDGTPFVIPSQHEDLLVNWSTGDMLDLDREYLKATQQQSQFYEKLSALQKEINNLAAYDKNLVLEPYWPLGRYGAAGSGNDVNFADNITPTGAIDGSNATYTLPSSPNPTSSLLLMKNGQVLFQGVGYTLTGSTIVYDTAYVLQTGDLHRVWYRT